MTAHFVKKLLFGDTAGRPAAAPGNTGWVYIDLEAQEITASTGSAWASGGLPAGVVGDGLGGLDAAGVLKAKPQILATYCGPIVVPAGSFSTHITPAVVEHDEPTFTATVGDSVIQVNTPGWYAVTARAISRTVGEAGAVYRLTDGGSFNYIAGSSPEDIRVGNAAAKTVLESTGYVLFDATNHSIDIKVNNLGAADATFDCYIMALYLGKN